MYNHRRVITSTVLAAIALGVVQPYKSIAQSPDGALEEVVVTAQRREQLISDVPLSIQAFTDDVLESIHVRDLSELINFVPGATIKNQPRGSDQSKISERRMPDWQVRRPVFGSKSRSLLSFRVETVVSARLASP